MNQILSFIFEHNLIMIEDMHARANIITLLLLNAKATLVMHNNK